MGSNPTLSATHRSRPLLALAFGAALSLLGTEAAIRIVYALRDAVPPTADPSLNAEWEWVARHQRAGDETVAIPGAYDPVLGWKLAPNVREAAVHTNNHGMRARADFDTEPAPGRRRLLLLGDSYTFGSGVRDGEAFAAILQRKLRSRWEVLNFGVPGYGTDQQVLLFEQVGRHFRPDVVVLAFFVRDYGRNLVRFSSYAKPRFVLGEGGTLRLVGSPVPSPEDLLAQYASGERQISGPPSYFVELLRERIGRLFARRIHESAEGWLLLAQLMNRFDQSVRESGAEPLWVVIPSEQRVEEGTDRYDALEDLVRAHAGGAMYRDEPGGHLGPAGHRTAASEIFTEMAERGWVEPTARRASR